jgi:large subunit ribosomal protein L17
MKNKIRLRRLNRTTSHRVALLRTMTTQLIAHGRLRTTLPKARELRRVAERAVGWAKDGSHAARVRARAFVRDNAAVDTLWADLAPRYRCARRRPGRARAAPAAGPLTFFPRRHCPRPPPSSQRPRRRLHARAALRLPVGRPRAHGAD